MGTAIGDILPAALGVAISPLPIVAVILILFSDRAVANGIAFVVGWIAGLAAAGTIVLVIAHAGDLGGGVDDDSRAGGVVRLLLGVVLVGLAVRSWTSRPAEGEEPSMPRWMQALDTMSPAAAAGIAALLSGVNPKNLALTATAAVSIAGAGLSTGEDAIVLAVFVVLASLTVATPVVLYLAARTQVTPLLERSKAWLLANNNTIVAVLLLVIGVKVVGDAIGILSS